MSQTDALASRLSFLKMDAAAEDRLRSIKPVIMRALPSALDNFYAQVKATPQMQRFFTSDGLIASAKERQLAHWETISSGRFDQQYVHAVSHAMRRETSDLIELMDFFTVASLEIDQQARRKPGLNASSNPAVSVAIRARGVAGAGPFDPPNQTTWEAS